MGDSLHMNKVIKINFFFFGKLFWPQLSLLNKRIQINCADHLKKKEINFLLL